MEFLPSKIGDSQLLRFADHHQGDGDHGRARDGRAAALDPPSAPEIVLSETVLSRPNIVETWRDVPKKGI